MHATTVQQTSPHLFPYLQKANDQTFYYTNVAPQHHKFNTQRCARLAYLDMLNTTYCRCRFNSHMKVLGCLPLPCAGRSHCDSSHSGVAVL